MFQQLVISDVHKIARSKKLAGAKARNLAVVQLHGYPVPEFIVLSAKSSHYSQEIDKNHRHYVDLISAVCKNKGIMLFKRPVVLRSSAPFEDTVEHSFAGQLDSFLNVMDETSFWDSIHAIWKSAHSKRLYTYIGDTRLRQLSPAVIIQNQINAQMAGVLFTAHPLNPQDLMLIEFHAGGCGDIVSGQVMPEQILVHRQSQKLVKDYEGDDYLTDFVHQQLPHLVSLAFDLENIFRHPLDIEWAFENQQFWILQARPITTLPISNRSDENSQKKQWSDFFFAERFHYPIAPLSWSFLQPLIVKNAFKDPLWYLGKLKRVKRPLTRLDNGLPVTRRQVFQLLYAPLPFSFISPDKRKELPLSHHRFHWLLEFARSIPFLASRLFFVDSQWLPWRNLYLWRIFRETTLRQLHELDLKLMTDSMREIIDVCEQTSELSDHFLAIHRWSITFADLFVSALAKFLLFTVNDRSLRTDDLLSGIKGNATFEANIELAALDPYERIQFNHFLAKYGHRSESLDFSFAPWKENPEQLLKMARLNVMGNTLETLRVENNNRRDLSIIKCLTVMAEKPYPIRLVLKPLFRCLLHSAQKFFMLRENQRDLWQRILYITRKGFLKLAGIMVMNGQLHEVDDIFYLTFSEIKIVMQGNTAPLSRISERRKRRIEWAEMPPQVLTQPISRRTLIGIGVSEGTVSGPARVVRRYEETQFINAGEILVAPAIDPGWTPLFRRISGLVLETGGVLSHAAIVAREFRMPAVTSIQNAAMIIKTGDIIRIDGKYGFVERIDDKAGS
ncbi:MAG: hypothetical protein EHM72_02890 [Calditrichaeota bacterium]|nr:MAG: hypothetical protein EHM72_02890 [Calditrichota bacterium]